MSLIDLWFVVLMGLGGSGHCVGMCGGFALAIGRGANGLAGLAARHLAYQAGKALTYVFLAVLVSAGFGMLGRSEWFASAQTVLAVAAGVFMVAYGASQVAEFRAGQWWQRIIEPLPGCRGFVAIAHTPGPLAAFVTGWLNGFIPCGLVVMAILYLAGLNSVGAAALGAAAFGAATFPSLFAFGLAAHAWAPRWRRALVRLTGVLLICFGTVTIVRAFPEGRAWLREIRGGGTPPAAETMPAEACH